MDFFLAYDRGGGDIGVATLKENDWLRANLGKIFPLNVGQPQISHLPRKTCHYVTVVSRRKMADKPWLCMSLL